MPTALVTGASAGLGRALATALTAQGWRVIITARNAERLHAVAESLLPPGSVTAIAGDVADPAHRAQLVSRITRLGGLDLLVNNASTLGPTPLGPLADLSPTDVANTLDTNATAPFALTAALLPQLAAASGVVIGISSDAAAEHYPGWGAYGASKAALDHLMLTFGVENPDIACYAIDPGDMRTDMQQAAFPGDDISDRRDPTEVAPAVLHLLAIRPPSGRYRASDWLPPAADDVATPGDTITQATLAQPTGGTP